MVPARAVAPVARPGTTVEIRLEGDLPEAFASTADLQVKQGELGTVDCRAPEGWLGAAEAAALAAADAGSWILWRSPGASPSASGATGPEVLADPEASPGAVPGPARERS